jgi:RimJ/RimL family protein N-acetyltransferase
MPDDQPTTAHSLPIIHGEHVYLRPAERTDLPTFVRWLNDAETTRNLALRAPISLPMEEQWFDKMLAAKGKSQFLFVICLADDHRAIGTTDLRNIDYENGGAAFGIVIGEKSEWNKGYGTDALNAITDFGFGALRLERIELDVYVGNDRARRSYEKAGFELEGTLRHAHFADGQHVDVDRMALLRADWLAQSRRKTWEPA